MLSDSPILGDSHSDVFPPPMSVSDHAELREWLDMNDAMYAAHQIDAEMDQMWAEEIQRRDLAESQSAAA